MYIRDGKFVELVHDYGETIWAEVDLKGDVIRLVEDDAAQIEIYRQEKQVFLENLKSETTPPIVIEWLKQISRFWLVKYWEKNYYVGLRIGESTYYFWPSFYSGGALMHYAYEHGFITNNYLEGWRFHLPKETQSDD